MRRSQYVDVPAYVVVLCLAGAALLLGCLEGCAP